ncbi:hypothetical protein [Streptomyces variegatus]
MTFSRSEHERLGLDRVPPPAAKDLDEQTARAYEMLIFSIYRRPHDAFLS